MTLILILLMGFVVACVALRPREKFNCPECRDTGILDRGTGMWACFHCRDLTNELDVAVKRLSKCSCKPFGLTQGDGGHFRCNTCGVSWGRAAI
jgi:hypothetical protein